MKNENITTLYLFDFDGCLADTPMPEVGKVLWSGYYNTKYPHVGWWSKKESLDMKVFQIHSFPETVREYEKSKKDPNGVVGLLTNRLITLKREIMEVVRSLGFQFDITSFNGGGKWESEPTKGIRLLSMLEDYPNVQKVYFWDDMQKHIDSVKDVQKVRPEIEIVTFLVNQEQHRTSGKDH